MTRFAFLWPAQFGEVWTDEAIASLVGQEFDMDFFGTPAGRCIVTNAFRREGLDDLDDDMLAKLELVRPGAGIWIEAERLEADSGS